MKWKSKSSCLYSLRWCVIILLPLASTQVEAFPDLIRSGYHSCKACHHDPNGGGPITDYGRTIAGAHLSTTSVPLEEETFYGAFNLAPFDLSGDLRYLYSQYQRGQETVTQRFWMQREISAIYATETLTLLGTTGVYGFDPLPQQRRWWGSLHNGGFMLRAGRFLPAFGYQIPDHTKATKQLFGQGQETVNLEASWTTEVFEVIATRMFGGVPTLDAGERPRIQPRDDKDGATGKLTLFLTKGVQAGGSYAVLRGETEEKAYASYYLFVGRERVWAMYETQSHPDGLRRYGMLGVMPLKGVWVKAELSEELGEREIFGTLQWFIRPHIETLMSYSKKQVIMLFHYYL